jgi:hypothetical protein
MSRAKAPASPLSRFIWSNAFQVVLVVELGKSNKAKAVVVDDGVSAVLPLLKSWLETFEISKMSSIAWLDVMVGAASSSVAILVAFDNADLFFKISGSCNNIQLAGYQPQSRMAVLLLSVLPKDFGQTRLTKGITSLLLMTVSELILVLKSISLPF